MNASRDQLDSHLGERLVVAAVIQHRVRVARRASASSRSTCLHQCVADQRPSTRAASRSRPASLQNLGRRLQQPHGILQLARPPSPRCLPPATAAPAPLVREPVRPRARSAGVPQGRAPAKSRACRPPRASRTPAHGSPRRRRPPGPRRRRRGNDSRAPRRCHPPPRPSVCLRCSRDREVLCLAVAPRQRAAARRCAAAPCRNEYWPSSAERTSSCTRAPAWPPAPSSSRPTSASVARPRPRSALAGVNDWPITAASCSSDRSDVIEVVQAGRDQRLQRLGNLEVGDLAGQHVASRPPATAARGRAASGRSRPRTAARPRRGRGSAAASASGSPGTRPSSRLVIEERASGSSTNVRVHSGRAVSSSGRPSARMKIGCSADHSSR